MKKIYYTEQKKDLISYRVFNFWNSECCQFNLAGFVNISFCFQIFYEAHRPVKMCEHCDSFVIWEAVEHCPNKIALHVSGKPTCKIRHINRVSLLPVFFFSHISRCLSRVFQVYKFYTPKGFLGAWRSL